MTADFTISVRQLVWRRSLGCCEVCGMYLPASGWNAHHRQARRMGGTRNDFARCASNALAVCGGGVSGCHGRIESNRLWAQQRGYLVPSWLRPAEEEVLLANYGWVLLGDDGTITPAAESAEVLW